MENSIWKKFNKKCAASFLLCLLCLMLWACENVDEGSMMGDTNGETENQVIQEKEDGEIETDTDWETEGNLEEETVDICILDENVEEGINLDTMLANAVREELGYETDALLTKSDLESVTYLAIFNEPVTSVKGVSLLSNLDTLRISGGEITDIGELSKMTSLTCIDISGCYIKKIPDLSACMELNTLYLGGNLIEDISPLENLKSLKYVNLSDNRIRSILPFKNMDTLEILAIDNNDIMDYDKVQDCPYLIEAINNGSQQTYEQGLEAENMAKSIVEGFPSDVSELELEKIIYQYVMDYMEYEVVYTDAAAPGYNALMNHKGVCGDYAELFCLLSNHAGIEAYVCNSDTHAWNIVKIDDRYYHCDSLWDEPEEEWIYFNVSGEYIRSIPDHMYDVKRYPDCDEI